ncbi:MAG: signal peptide peptidase SppA [Desulfobulbaceae bacterium]|nr:signal peptide peptidase SppA [Desulfobulbaceae bacterium]
MKKVFRILLKIFAALGHLVTVLRATLSLLIFAIVVALVITLCLVDHQRPIDSGTILTLKLQGNISEEKRANPPFAGLVREMAADDEESGDIVLQDVIDVIDAAAKDRKIAAIVLKTSNLGNAGIDQLHRIGLALESFKKTGRQVIAADDWYSQKQYYLASFADTVIVNPMGTVMLHGFGSYPLYFQEALEKLRIHFHVFKVGTYKSATEPLTRNDMSDEARRQDKEWLSSLWQTFSGEIEQRRGLPQGGLQSFIDQMAVTMRVAKGDAAKMAKDAKLADKIFTREETLAYLKKLGNLTADGELKSVSFKEYLSRLILSYQKQDDQPGQIGIIVAEGQIVAGRRAQKGIACDALAATIRSARKNNNIRAVVLRINSGGGSAFASEIIRQELLQLRKSGKKLLVSMGPVAASGAYWLAADADQIWAAPTTLTGSIGIFGAVPTFEDSLAALGVHSDGVGTSDLAAGLNLTRELPPVLAESIQLSVENGYRRFIDIVAEGRKMTPAAVEGIAEGRVYSGRDAQKLGLVDKLGGLDEAIAAAADMCGLKQYRAVYIKQKTSIRQQFLALFHAYETGDIAAILGWFTDSPALAAVFGPNQPLALDDPNHCYALTLASSPLR